MKSKEFVYFENDKELFRLKNRKDSKGANTMMFITKFNRLIRSKILWLIFAVVIVFAFVFWDLNTTGISQAEHQNTAGKLDGESISNKEFRETHTHTPISKR